MRFSIIIPLIGGVLIFGGIALSQTVPLMEIQHPNRSDETRQHLLRWQGMLQGMQEALERDRSPLTEEELRQRQEWLDNVGQVILPDEELQRRQEWIDNQRRGQHASFFSDVELQQRQEYIDEQMQKLTEQLQQLDAAVAHREYLNGLLQRGFDHREQIKSGQMVIAKRLKTWSPDGSEEGEMTMEITIAFDENRRRVDRRVTYANGVLVNDVGCIGCYKKDNRLLLEYSDYQTGPNLRRAIEIYDVKQLDENILTNFWTNRYGIIPQYLGYFQLDRFPTKARLESAKRYLLVNTIGMLDSGVTAVTITEENHKGVLCKKIVFETNWPDGRVTRNTLWIAEEQGYALRKRYFQNASGHDVLLEVDVALDADSGIWFPSAWYYEQSRDGKPYTRESVTIKNVALNKPLPESLFDMKDIKIIPVGAGVIWTAELVSPPHRGQLIWDGNDFVTRGMFNEGLVAQMAAQNRSERFQTMILINVAIVGLILSVFFWRMYQRVKLQN